MSIEAFKAAFAYGVRPNLYKMEIFGLPEKLQYLCKATQLPGKNIGIIEVPYLNHKAKLAGDATFDDLTVTIMLDNDFSVRDELESWMEGARANADINGDEPSIYKQNGTVIQLDNQNNELAQYDFIGLWPSSLAPLDLAFETNDTIAEYTVTFTYDYWVRTK